MNNEESGSLHLSCTLIGALDDVDVATHKNKCCYTVSVLLLVLARRAKREQQQQQQHRSAISMKNENGESIIHAVFTPPKTV